MTAFSETGAELLSRLASAETVKTLDLFNGLPTGQVIEISGESGSGKTELLYSWIIHTLLPKTWKNIHFGGENSSVIFIDTNLQFNIFRLITTMEMKILDKISVVAGATTPTESELKNFVKSCLSFLHLLHCKNSEQFMVTLHGFNELLLTSEKKASLLIIDSITLFYWLDKMQKLDQVWRMEEHNNFIVQALKKIVDEHKITLVATRQLLLKAERNHLFTDELVVNIRDFDFLGKLWRRLVTFQVWLTKEAVASGCTLINIHMLKNNTRVLSRGAVINGRGLCLKDDSI